MDVHRLRSVIGRVIDEHHRLEIDEKLAKAVEALDECVTHPSPARDEHFRGILLELLDELSRAPTNELVESDRRILAGIRGDQFVGRGLAEWLRRLADERPFLAARAKDQYERLAKTLRAYREVLARIDEGFGKLGIDAVLQQEEAAYEIGILLPEALTKGNLERVSRELKAWDEKLRALFLVITTRPAVLSVRCVSSTCFELSALIDRDGALVLGTAIVGLHQIFKKVQSNRRTVTALTEQGYPQHIVGSLKGWENQMAQAELRGLKEQLMAMPACTEKTKQKDVERHLEHVLKFLATKISDGVRVEIAPPAGADISVPGGENAEPDGLGGVPHEVRASLRVAWRESEGGKVRSNRAVHLSLHQLSGSDSSESGSHAA